tara:strand:+ start:130 stop:708 length:579 start_codon:yes stop_codon:yes gene_type:complete
MNNCKNILYRVLFFFLIIISTISLSGCGVTDFITKKSITLPCPDFRILADASILTKFRPGPGRDLTDVDHNAKIENARISCISDIDEESFVGTMDVDVEVMFSVERGPVNRNRLAKLPYFISVIDAKKNILYRETFNILVKFLGNRSRMSVMTEPIILEIPIKKGVSGRDFLIYIGMQLTEEELRFVRERGD